ncbi:MAG TPA: DALR anticodon-binding domain-containing protein [Streptosporangiaceae bacterium]|nr:DALR anticodon-binding domain-containing protein [Streptosporangiaceae bacterium]
MIPGDIGAEISRVLQAMVAAGELPEQAASLSAAGTWRPAPAETGGGPGTYATSLPLAVAGLTGRAAEPVAELLAAGLAAVPWIGSARMTGGGYLTVTVTAARLAGLPARIAGSGPGAAASGALAGTRLTAPRLADPATAPGWEQAWRTQRDALAGRLADAAGADVLFFDSQREPTPEPTTQAHAGPVPVTTDDIGGGPAARAGRGPVNAAVAQHGADAVRYALARTSAPRAGAFSRLLGLPLDLTNPFVTVRYSHADAASVLRWAADLGLAPDQQAERHQRVPSLMPPELVLVDAMSWLPERVAAAARRRRPAELAAYLENLASAWLDCADSCPALPFRGRGAPAALAGEQTAARLELADAARVVLDAGLTLLGISAPARM